MDRTKLRTVIATSQSMQINALPKPFRNSRLQAGASAGRPSLPCRPHHPCKRYKTEPTARKPPCCPCIPDNKAPITQDSDASPPSASSSSSSASDDAAYQALVLELSALSPQQIREAANSRPEQLLDSRFLFWLRDQERRAALGGAALGPVGRLPAAERREVLERLGRELTMMREWK
ncbi:hypothetical protein Agub_g12571, partial [Astrephomene gubernaculifera]